MSCVICFNVYNEIYKPKVLPCGHDLCAHCISQLKSRGTVICPTCRSWCPGDPAGWPVVYALMGASAVPSATATASESVRQNVACDASRSAQELAEYHGVTQQELQSQEAQLRKFNAQAEEANKQKRPRGKGTEGKTGKRQRPKRQRARETEEDNSQVKKIRIVTKDFQFSTEYKQTMVYKSGKKTTTTWVSPTPEVNINVTHYPLHGQWCI